VNSIPPYLHYPLSERRFETAMTDRNDMFVRLRERIREVISDGEDRERKLARVCYLIEGTLDGYDWVGFYLVDPANPDMLVLGPFAGAPTEHVRIRIGQGICGQALATKETFVVPDVTKEANYLACSADVRSEIVVPIMRGGRRLGELDIDSHTINAFGGEDRGFLEAVAGDVAGLF